VNLLRWVDKYFIKFVLFLLFPFRSLFFNKLKNKKILVIRLWGLGDSINVLPIVKKLNCAGFEVDVLTTKNTRFIFEEQKFISKVIIFDFLSFFKFLKLIMDLNKNNYEFVVDTEQFMNISTLISCLIGAREKIGFDLLFRRNFYNYSYNYSEKHHFQENFVKLLGEFGLGGVAESLEPIVFNLNNEKNIENLLDKFDIRGFKLVGVHLGTAGTALGRRWSGRKFVQLINKLGGLNVKVILTGSNFESEIYEGIYSEILNENVINLINKTSIRDFAYLLTKLDVFVSNDTGVMHISAAMGCRTIGLFGLNSPTKVGAWPIDKNINLYKNPDNNPIINNKFSIYPDDKFSTVNLITVDEVYDEIVKILNF